MTDADREKLLNVLTESRDAMTGALAGSGVERVSEGWNALQIAEHITLTEDMIFKLVTERIAAMPANPGMREKIQWSDDDILTRVSRPSEKREAPEAVRPKNTYTKLDDAIAAFAQARTLTIEYVATTPDDLRNRVFPHPGLGPIDGVQWLIFQVAHTFRHAHQLEGIGVGNKAQA